MIRCHQSPDDVDRRFDELLSRSLAVFRERQKEFRSIASQFDRWHLDLDDCTLRFSSDAGSVRYRIVPIGSYVHGAQDWMWSWANEIVPPSARKKSEKIRELFDVTSYKIFASPTFTVRESDVEELCALSACHLNAEGIFQSRSDDTTRIVAVMGKEDGEPGATDNPDDAQRI